MGCDDTKTPGHVARAAIYQRSLALTLSGSGGVPGAPWCLPTRLAPLLQRPCLPSVPVSAAHAMHLEDHVKAGSSASVAAARAASAAHAVYLQDRVKPRRRRMPCICKIASRPDAACAAATGDRGVSVAAAHAVYLEDRVKAGRGLRRCYRGSWCFCSSGASRVGGACGVSGGPRQGRTRCYRGIAVFL